MSCIYCEDETSVSAGYTILTKEIEIYVKGGTKLFKFSDLVVSHVEEIDEKTERVFLISTSFIYIALELDVDISSKLIKDLENSNSEQEESIILVDPSLPFDNKVNNGHGNGDDNINKDPEDLVGMDHDNRRAKDQGLHEEKVFERGYPMWLLNDFVRLGLLTSTSEQSIQHSSPNNSVLNRTHLCSPSAYKGAMILPCSTGDCSLCKGCTFSQPGVAWVAMSGLSQTHIPSSKGSCSSSRNTRNYTSLCRYRVKLCDMAEKYPAAEKRNRSGSRNSRGQFGSKSNSPAFLSKSDVILGRTGVSTNVSESAHTEETAHTEHDDLFFDPVSTAHALDVTFDYIETVSPPPTLLSTSKTSVLLYFIGKKYDSISRYLTTWECPIEYGDFQQKDLESVVLDLFDSFVSGIDVFLLQTKDSLRYKKDVIDLVSKYVTIATSLANSIISGVSVVLLGVCGDKKMQTKEDSDAILCVLVQLLLDDYYRTAKGFVILVLKELMLPGPWGSLLFLCQCVFSIMRFHPTLFEFNTTFLIRFCDNNYESSMRSLHTSCFSENSKFNILNGVFSSTLRSFEPSMMNPHFSAKDTYINLTIERPSLWLDYYCRGIKGNAKIKVEESVILVDNPSTTSSLSEKLLTSSEEIAASKLRIEMNLGRLIPQIPPVILNMRRLKTLHLSHNHITSHPMSLSRLKSLTDLSIEGNYLASLPILPQSLKNINVASNLLTSFPVHIQKLKLLRTLNASNNNLSRLPSGICVHMTNLTSLNLDNNKITSVASTVSILSRLTDISLKSNPLRSLPPELFSMRNIQRIDLSFNNISSLPEPQPIGSMALFYLNLSHNHLNTFPVLIKRYYKLKELYMESNKLSRFPTWLHFLSNLKILDVGDNELTSLVSGIGTLTKLKRLALKNNHIKNLPFSLGMLYENLKELEIDETQITNIPPASLESTQSILKYMRAELMQQIHIYRGKVLFVGPAFSGKTSLAQAVENTMKRKLGEEVTTTPAQAEFSDPSLCIRSISFDLNEKIKKKKSVSKHSVKKDKRGANMEVSIWDLHLPHGLQKYLHHFFITPKSVVVLTIKAMEPRGKEKLYFWIRSVVVRCSKLQLLVVATHSDLVPSEKGLKEWKSDLEASLLNEFGLELSILCVSCLNNDNIDKFTELLRHTLLNNPTVNTKIPFKFTLFEQMIKEFGDHIINPYLTSVEYQQLGNMLDLTKSMMQNYSTYLNLSGSLLYHQNMEVLNDIVVYDLTLLISLVHSIYNCAEKNQGVLSKSDLLNIFPTFSPHQRARVIVLMEKFDVLMKTNLKSLGTMRTTKHNRRISKDSHKQNQRNPLSVYVISSLLSTTINPAAINSWLNKAKNANVHYQRWYCFDFLPEGCAMHLFNSIASRASLIRQLWKCGMIGSWGHDNVAELYVEVVGADFGKMTRSGSLGNNSIGGGNCADSNSSQTKSNELVVHCSGEHRDQVAAAFSWIVELMASVIAEWPESKWEEYVEGPLVGVSRDRLKVSFARRKVFSGVDTLYLGEDELVLSDLLPDYSLITYTGIRYPYPLIQKKMVIGEGSFAMVYKACIEGSPVALKELKHGYEEDNLVPFFEFSSEVLKQSRAAHPNVVAVQGIVLKPLCIIFPFLHGALDPPLAHLDLKSPNILLKSLEYTDAVVAQITDFGTSQYSTQSFSKCSVENPIWASPEILRGSEFDQTVDNYSYGVIAWELLTRETFFGSEFFHVIADRVISGERPELPESKTYPAEYGRVVEEMWCNNPSARLSWSSVIYLLEAMLINGEAIEKRYGTRATFQSKAPPSSDERGMVSPVQLQCDSDSPPSFSKMGSTTSTSLSPSSSPSTSPLTSPGPRVGLFSSIPVVPPRRTSAAYSRTPPISSKSGSSSRSRIRTRTRSRSSGGHDGSISSHAAKLKKPYPSVGSDDSSWKKRKLAKKRTRTESGATTSGEFGLRLNSRGRYTTSRDVSPISSRPQLTKSKSSRSLGTGRFSSYKIPEAVSSIQIREVYEKPDLFSSFHSFLSTKGENQASYLDFHAAAVRYSSTSSHKDRTLQAKAIYKTFIESEIISPSRATKKLGIFKSLDDALSSDIYPRELFQELLRWIEGRYLYPLFQDFRLLEQSSSHPTSPSDTPPEIPELRHSVSENFVPTHIVSTLPSPNSRREGSPSDTHRRWHSSSTPLSSNRPAISEFKLSGVPVAVTEESEDENQEDVFHSRK